MTPFRTESFANGIRLSFIDRSNRYFGDYHRVCIEVLIQVPPPEGPFELVRRLERMAVPGGAVETVRDQLVGDFLHNAGRYLKHADYPARLVAREAPNRGVHLRRC